MKYLKKRELIIVKSVCKLFYKVACHINIMEMYLFSTPFFSFPSPILSSTLFHLIISSLFPLSFQKTTGWSCGDVHPTINSRVIFAAIFQIQEWSCFKISSLFKLEQAANLTIWNLISFHLWIKILIVGGNGDFFQEINVCMHFNFS